MAKIKFGELILSTLSPVLETVINSKLYDILEDLAVKEPEAHKTICISLYPAIDVHLEKLTLKSRTRIDDSVVNGIKAAIELSAEEHGIELPNLDED